MFFRLKSYSYTLFIERNALSLFPDGSDKCEICCSITFVFVTFLCFYIGFTCFGGSAGLNMKSNLSFDYIRPCCLTDNEFNLDLVHFNNSTALIAGLKGFALFWQQKVFIKFTCLFTFSVYEPAFSHDRARNWCCGIVKSFLKAVRFIYQYSWNLNSNFHSVLHWSLSKQSHVKIGIWYHLRKFNPTIFGDDNFLFGTNRPRFLLAASFLSSDETK